MENPDDNISEGSNEEHLIFRDTFFGTKCCGKSGNRAQSGIFMDTTAASSGEHSAQSTFMDLQPEDSSKSHAKSKGRADDNQNPKRLKSSVGEVLHEKTCTRNVLNPSVLQKESISNTSQPASGSSCQTAVFRFVEFSDKSVTSSCYGCKGLSEEDGTDDDDVFHNKISILEHNDGKAVFAGKQVTSPVSQGSCATKATVSSPPIVASGSSNSQLCNEDNKVELHRQKMEVSDKLAISGLLKDTRDQLNDQVNRFMEAAGWHSQVVRRDCRSYNEKIYIHKSGKKAREFPKFWRLLGRSLEVNKKNMVVENPNYLWTDLGHFCSDLAIMLVQTDKLISGTLENTGLAHVWNLLDPFVYVMFIDRKIGSLRRGIAFQAMRSIPLNAQVKNNGVLSFELSDGSRIQHPDTSTPTQPITSSLATGSALIAFEEIHIKQQDTVGNLRIPYSGGMCQGTLSKPKKSKNKINEHTASDTQVVKCQFGTDSGKLGRDFISTQSKKASTKQGNVSGTSFFNVHIDFIDNWSYGHGKLEVEDPDDMPIAGDTEAQTLNDIVVSRGSDGLQFDSHDHKMMQSSTSSLVESNLDPSRFQVVKTSSQMATFRERKHKYSATKLAMAYKMQIESGMEFEHDVASLHDVVVFWDKENFSSNKQTDMKFAGGCLDGSLVEAANAGKSYVPSKNGIIRQIEDDDLLVSATIKSRYGSHSKGCTASKLKVGKSKYRRKVKSGRRNCNLLPGSSGERGQHCGSDMGSLLGTKTPLSWLIDTHAVHLGEVIQCRISKSVVKEGFLTKDGILCRCCKKVLSMSMFKLHAGSNQTCSNLFMKSGKPYDLCQLLGWSTEYLRRKNKEKPTQIEDEDESDDICGLCGEAGDLICCDNCPATFHKDCLSPQDIPEGSWYCSRCTCQICGDLSGGESSERLKCSQCEQKYHKACLEVGAMKEVVTSDPWFCSEICEEVHLGLRSRIGVVKRIANGFSFSLLKCIHADQKGKFGNWLDCGTKLAVALTIMEECFAAMVDPRTGINMIPQMMYNFGSIFPRLDFHGFYSVVLEKDDALLCVASIRIHGVSVAEVPFVATCINYRRQGMCRRLMDAIEEMLRSLAIEKIVISAVPELVETWEVGFGYELVDDEEKASLKAFNFVVLPGTVLLRKTLLENHPSEQLTLHTISSSALPNPTPAADPVSEHLQQRNIHVMSANTDTNIRINSDMLSKLCEDPASTVVVN